MATTRPAVVTINQLRSQFEPGLFQFLTALHQRKGEETVDDIYGQYNKSQVIIADQDDAFWKEQRCHLLRGLSELGSEVYLQTDLHGPEPLDLEVNCAFYLEGADIIGVETPDDLINGVYWFEGPEPMAAAHRVYIHLAHPIAVSGITVLKALIPQFQRIRGFRKIKMFGPRQGLRRNDNIVAYLSDERAQADLVAEARRLPPNLFEADLPNWVKSVARGVGIADEPPHAEVFRMVNRLPFLAADDDFDNDTKGQSFGKFISKLIWMARMYNTGGTEEGFLKLVLVAFHVAGMDAKNPHKHSRGAFVESMQPNLPNALREALKLEGAGGRAFLRRSVGS